MHFKDIEFPRSLIPYFNKEVSYLTNVAKLQDGREARQALQEKRIIKYQLFKTITKEEKITILESFFHITQGRKHSFKMLDPTENQIENTPCQNVGTHSAQLQKVYYVGSMASFYKITKVNAGTLTVYKNNALLPSGYNVDSNTGIITFETPIENDVITATCQYFKHVRFNTDTIMFAMKGGASFEIDALSMVEVL